MRLVFVFRCIDNYCFAPFKNPVALVAKIQPNEQDSLDNSDLDMLVVDKGTLDRWHFWSEYKLTRLDKLT